MMGIVLWAAPEKGRRTVELSVMNAAGVRFVCAQVVRGPRTPEALARGFDWDAVPRQDIRLPEGLS